jgi:hypothetical protein
MSKAIALVALLAAVFAATAIAGNPDPRKCSYSTIRAQCAHDNAVSALRRKQSLILYGKANTRWTADITCTAKSAKLLLWACKWTAGPAPHAATVKFWATSTGWHTQVALAAA